MGNGHLGGALNEQKQSLKFIVTSDNPSLFSSSPAISSDGTLNYTPGRDAYGSATVTVKLQDNGGTARGGVDTSPSQTFKITVTAVNDCPSFSGGNDVTVLEDSGPATIANWAKNIAAGPNESQALSFLVTTDNAALFSATPVITPSGTLSFTPTANAQGSAKVTVRSEGRRRHGQPRI